MPYEIPIILPFEPLDPPLFENRTHLLAAFEKVASRFSHTAQDALRNFSLLSQSLKGSAAAWSLLDKDWCYYFGQPYTGLHDNTLVVGSPQIPKVEFLYRVIEVVRKHLPAQDQQRIFDQLGQQGKHADFLEELAPLLRISDPSAVINYEVPGEGNSLIEFSIAIAGKQPVLLEVKNRVKDLIHHLGHFTRNEAARVIEADIPPPQPEWLFKSVMHKFSPTPFSQRAQGVWVHSNISIPRTALHDYFDTLDNEKLHFAILSAGEDLAYILARTQEIHDFVQDFFHLKHHEHCVC